MKALTIRQPWASLVAVGAKTIETRGWSTKYRGELLIHAGKRKADVTTAPLDVLLTWHEHDAMIRPLPLGAVVASCRLADCVPIVDATDRSPASLATVSPCVAWDADCGLYLFRTAGSDENEQIDEQLPFGDFSPGRFAWLLEDVKPTTERCPRWVAEGRYPLPNGPRSSCPTCDGWGHCAPVPMRGRQSLWTPKPEDWPSCEPIA